MHRHGDFGNDIVGIVAEIVNDLPDREGHDGLQGEMLAEVSRAVVGLHKELYGKAYETKDILNGNVAVPAAASKLISLLGKYSARKTG